MIPLQIMIIKYPATMFANNYFNFNFKIIKMKQTLPISTLVFMTALGLSKVDAKPKKAEPKLDPQVVELAELARDNDPFYSGLRDRISKFIEEELEGVVKGSDGYYAITRARMGFDFVGAHQTNVAKIYNHPNMYQVELEEDGTKILIQYIDGGKKVEDGNGQFDSADTLIIKVGRNCDFFDEGKGCDLYLVFTDHGLDGVFDKFEDKVKLVGGHDTLTEQEKKFALAVREKLGMKQARDKYPNEDYLPLFYSFTAQGGMGKPDIKPARELLSGEHKKYVKKATKYLRQKMPQKKGK